VELEVRELLKKYEFPGDEIPVVRRERAGGLERRGAVGEGRHRADGGGGRLRTDSGAADRQAVSDAIEDIFSIQGRGTVVTGRVEKGKVKVGEEMEIVGFRETRKTVVTGVEMFKKLLDEGQAGTT